MFALQKKKRILKGALFSSILLVVTAAVFMVLKQVSLDVKVDAADSNYIIHLVRNFVDSSNPMSLPYPLNDHSLAYSVPSRGEGAIDFKITSSQIGSGNLLYAACASPNFRGPDTYNNANGNGERQPAANGIDLPAALMTPSDIITNENVSSYNINGYNDASKNQLRYDALRLLSYFFSRGEGTTPYMDFPEMDTLLGLTGNFYNRYLTSEYNGTAFEQPNFNHDLVDGNGNVRKDNIRRGFIHAVMIALLHGNSYSVELREDAAYQDRTKVRDLANAIMAGVERMNNGQAFNGDATFSAWVRDKWAQATKHRMYHLDISKFGTGNWSMLSYNNYNRTLTTDATHTIAPWKDVNAGNQDVIWTESPVYGSITITGCDAETGGCASLGSSSMKDTTFEIINKSGHPIYYNNEVIENNGQVIVKAITDKDICALPKVSNLPYGTYEVKQTQSGTGYNQTTETKTVTIPGNGNVDFTVSLCNQVIRGDVKFKKVDQTGKPMANVAFKITSKTTGENHIVVTNAEGIVDTSLIAHTSNTNAYDSLSSDNYVYHNDYGTWFGKKADGTIVAAKDDLGALPYDSYTIEELHCEANGSCYEDSLGIHSNFDFSITLNNRIVEFNESWENTCIDFSIVTVATDNKDGDKFILANKEAEIKDTISYTLKKDQEYTIKGVLMNKETNEPLEIDGKTFENSITVQSDKEKGEATMIFKIPDASSLGGKQIVVFETLYEGEEVIETHEDINDTKQTVLFVNLDTTAKDKADGNQSVLPEKDVTIVDSIDYCLLKDLEYIVEGTLMDKSTGEPLLIGGAPVIKTIELKAIKSCGKVEMEFTIDASQLGGTDIVVFERVYLKDDEDEKGTLVVEHTDINDDAQLIKVLEPEIPDTGFITSSNKGSDSNNPTIIIAIASITIVIMSAAGARVMARKKFLR